LWTTAYNTSFLLLYLLLDMWIFADRPSGSTNTKSYVGKDDSNGFMDSGDNSKHYPSSNGIDNVVIGNPPKLFDAINKHGLAIFLIANLFTGLINLSISTMYVEDATAMWILSLYSIAICAVGWYWPSRTPKTVH